MSRDVPARSETSGGAAVSVAARLAAVALEAGRVNRRVRVSRDMSAGWRPGRIVRESADSRQVADAAILIGRAGIMDIRPAIRVLPAS